MFSFLIFNVVLHRCLIEDKIQQSVPSVQWLHSFQCWNNVLRICGARKKTVDDFLKVLQLYLIVFIISDLRPLALGGMCSPKSGWKLSVVWCVLLWSTVSVPLLWNQCLFLCRVSWWKPPWSVINSRKTASVRSFHKESRPWKGWTVATVSRCTAFFVCTFSDGA